MISSISDMLNNGGGTSGAGHLGDGVDGGCAVNLGDDMASLDRGNLLDGDGDIDAMFGFDLSAGSFNGLGDGLRDGISYRGRGNMSKAMDAMSVGKTGKELRISFSFGFTFDDKSSVS